MINEPPVDELLKNIGDKYEGSKYALCVVVSKRARDLIDISRNQGTAVLGNKKPLTAAAYEIYEGKILAQNN